MLKYKHILSVLSSHGGCSLTFDKKLFCVYELNMIYKIIQVTTLYVAAYLIELLAKEQSFFWILFLPVATAAVLTTFDLLMGIVDLEEIKILKDQNKYVYIVGVCILSAGFAVATALFLK